jgi:hypothetical protein
VLGLAHLRDRGQIIEFGTFVLAESLDGRMHGAVLAHDAFGLYSGSQFSREESQLGEAANNLGRHITKPLPKATGKLASLHIPRCAAARLGQ